MAEKEEYELVPLSPLRRLERRIEKIESTPDVDTKTFFKELVEIVRMNQQLVDQLAKANDALRIEVSKLPGKMEELISNMDELISFIKASAAEEEAAVSLKPLLKKMDRLIEGNKKIVEGNKSMLTTLDKLSERLKGPVMKRRVKLKKKSKLPPLKPR